MLHNRPTRPQRAVLLMCVLLAILFSACAPKTSPTPTALQPAPTQTAPPAPAATQSPAVTSGAWSDEFDAPALAEGWRWLRQDADKWSLSARPGWLRIQTQWQRLTTGAPNSLENVLLRAAPAGDWSITAQVAFTPTQDAQQATLWVYRNDDNWIALERTFCAECTSFTQAVFLESEQEGVSSSMGAAASGPGTAYLRMQRAGSRYTASYSADGASWSVVGAVERPDLTDVRVGLSASNAGKDPAAPSLPADFGWFRLESAQRLTYLPAVPQPEGELVPLIFDDDGSPDGMIALLYLLRHPRVQVRAITVSCGEAHPAVFAQNLLRLLARLGRSDIPVGAGRETPLEGNNAFPDSWRRGSDSFWGVQLPAAEGKAKAVPAVDLIVRTLRESSEPVVLFVSGTHTNLAEALRLDPSIAAKVRLVQVMGGAFYVAGNLHSDLPSNPNTVSEWNIWVDPVAASEVLAAKLPMRFVGIDATNQVRFSSADADALKSSRSPEGLVAADLMRSLVGRGGGGPVWDAQTAVDLTDPGLTWTDAVHLEVITAPGDQQGRTMPSTVRPANASIALIPDAAAIRARLTAVLTGGQ